MFQNPPIMKQGLPTTNSQRNSKTNKGKTRRKRREKGEGKKNNKAPHYFYILY